MNYDSNQTEIDELKLVLSSCIDMIEKLTNDNIQLQERVNNLYSITKSVIDSQNAINESVNTVTINHDSLNACIDNIKYEALDPEFQDKAYFPKFYDIDYTINKLVNNRCSLARFGDAEYSIMQNIYRHAYQRLDARLADRLNSVIKVDDENFLIGIAKNYGNLDKYNTQTKNGIRIYMTDEIRSFHSEILNLNKTYHDAYITRPYVIYADNNTDAPRKRFEALKKIWDKRDIIFVEGSLSRLGVGNDLFDNASSIRRIEAPATSSFDKYDEILEAALQFGDEDTLFLIALGPSAGVLAYDLFKAGFQAIDIGHLDLEYEWMLNGKGERSEVRTKYNNEMPNGDQVEDIDDEDYLQQIICNLG